MNAEKFRHLYDFHFEFNRRLLDYCAKSLTNEQFVQELKYSHGSVRSLLVHIMSVDENWFRGFYEPAKPDPLDAESFPTPQAIAEEWKDVEEKMRVYLKDLEDSNLDEVFIEGLKKWQVLFHVINHATHHRAQIFAMLGQLGVKAYPQDYAIHILGRI
ncbi:MAG: DinB family protein [Candidatus Thorarchaeota archaeon]|jgi:uncharacterized damage-inducible protein DinB